MPIFYGQLPVELKLANRRLNFLSKMAYSWEHNLYCYLLDSNRSELKELMAKYNIKITERVSGLDPNLNRADWRNLLFEGFEASIFHVALVP